MSLRDIALQFNLEKDAICRHKANHLPSRVAGAIAKRKLDSDDEFLTGLLKTAARCDKGLAHAVAALQEGLVEPELAYRMGPAYAAQASRARELIGQATGRLNAGAAQVGVNIALQVVIPRDLAAAAVPAQVEPAVDCQVIDSAKELAE